MHSEPQIITLRSDSISVEILTAGASVRSLHIPGVPHSLVVGAEDRAVYGAANRPFLGATIGRHANRIASGRLIVADEVHDLSINEPPHHLHGGVGGFWSRDWSVVEATETRAVLSLSAAEGEDGYPGRADVTATFALADGGILEIAYEGSVSRESVMNLTAHLYFNLSGKPTTQDHHLTVAAASYLPVDAGLIPTGEIAAVAGTPFDFRMGRRLADGPSMLDHNFCLDGGRQTVPRPIARLSCEEAGVALEISSGEAGLQVYDGAKFDATIPGLDGRGIGRHGAIALEPQGWPDAPNQPNFPATRLRPGETYRHDSHYRFTRI
ncbi:aldose 1-epimerase [Aureimonas sp. SA4125]|uniref:aldose epimerase family protein n=1 Tax=Aureimonas sp. SA4125 TaxID=2826993 RepID=UPI001CC579E4|nr:aldose epimerase family protein [Aureimonas sp. SA4125]BDA82608.1 aldose 1-epimerase [Aureimonas sp. SA4125]